MGPAAPPALQHLHFGFTPTSRSKSLPWHWACLSPRHALSVSGNLRHCVPHVAGPRGRRLVRPAGIANSARSAAFIAISPDRRLSRCDKRRNRTLTAICYIASLPPSHGVHRDRLISSRRRSVASHQPADTICIRRQSSRPARYITCHHVTASICL